MSKIRTFEAIKVWGPCGGCYHGGFKEIIEMAAYRVDIPGIPVIGLDGVCECEQILDKPAGFACLAFGGRHENRCERGEIKVSCERYIERNEEGDVLMIGQVLEGKHSGNKYHRTIYHVNGEGFTVVDVYCVLEAFNVTNPGLQHAIKKLLCAGLRGKGDTLQDLKEAQDAISRAITIEQHRTGKTN